MTILRFAASGLALALLVLSSASAADADGQRWDLDRSAALPEKLRLEADHRTRFEFLGDTFRPSGNNLQSGFALRTRVRAGIALAPWLRIAAEFQDSRVLGEESSLRLNSSVVNTTELLRVYAELTGDGPFGGTQTLRGGRLTIDIGDRRLVARNRFRNTSNAFTGLDWQWKGDRSRELRIFWTLPIQRRPEGSSLSAGTDYRWDHESTAVQFVGAFAAMDLPGCEGGNRLELFAFGLWEGDEAERQTRNRELVTSGFRLFRKPAPGKLDYQVESVVQFGNSRSSTSTLAPQLDHLAHFHHAEVGYRFDAPGQLRFALQYDFASGDKDSTDGKNQRFDTLYGARRLDFGPTSIYGPFARANLHSPGIRAQFAPSFGFTSFVSVRPFWRASTGDVWTTASPLGTATSSKYIGTQTEIRVRWDVVPKNIRIEAGYAHLFKGRVAKSGAASRHDSDYVYTQVLLTF